MSTPRRDAIDAFETGLRKFFDREGVHSFLVSCDDAAEIVVHAARRRDGQLVAVGRVVSFDEVWNQDPNVLGAAVGKFLDDALSGDATDPHRSAPRFSSS